MLLRGPVEVRVVTQTGVGHRAGRLAGIANVGTFYFDTADYYTDLCRFRIDDEVGTHSPGAAAIHTSRAFEMGGFSAAIARTSRTGTARPRTPD
jgi:hypothetical protein